MKITKGQLRKIIAEEKQKLMKESIADMADFENMIDDFAVDVADMFQTKMLELSKEEPELVGSYKSFNEEAFRGAQLLESKVAAAISDAVAEVEAMLHNGSFAR